MFDHTFQRIYCHELVQLAAMTVMNRTAGKAGTVRQVWAGTAFFANPVHTTKFMSSRFIHDSMPHITESGLLLKMLAWGQYSIRADNNTAAIGNTGIHSKSASDSHHSFHLKTGALDHRDRQLTLFSRKTWHVHFL